MSGAEIGLPIGITAAFIVVGIVVLFFVLRRAARRFYHRVPPD